MEELRSEDLEELVQELVEEYGAQESPPQEVEEVLRVLQSGSLYVARWNAAEQLGKVDTSSPRIVQALMVARKSDTHTVVRDAAARALRASAHQAVLQEHPDLVKRAESALEQAAIQREKQRAVGTGEVHNRKKPADSWQIIPVIAFGVVWIGIVAASGAIKLPWLFALVALPGAAMLAMGLWSWLAASSARNVFLRSMKETVGTVEDLDKKEHRGEYADTYKCFVTVLFEAEDANMGTRVMVLKAQVAHRLWKGLRCGESARIQYAAEDPRIALIQGEREVS